MEESPPLIKEWISKVENGEEGYVQMSRQLVLHYRTMGQLDSCMYYIQKGIQHAEDKNIREDIMPVYSSMITLSQEMSLKDSVDLYTSKQLNVIGDFRDFTSLNQKAYVFHVRGRTLFYVDNDFSNPKLYEYLRKAADIAEEINDIRRYLSVHLDICNLYYGKKEEQKLAELIKKVERKVKSIKDFDEKNTDFLNIKLFNANLIADNSTDIEERKQGIKQYKDLMAIHREAGDRHSLFAVMTNMVGIFGKDLESDTLIKYSAEAYDIRKELNFPTSAAITTANYGKALYRVGEYEKAIIILKEAEELADQLESADYNVLEITTNFLFLSYAALGQHDNFLAYHEKFKDYSEKKHSQDKENSLTELEVRYELRQEEAKNETLRAQNDLIQSRFQYLSILGASLLALLTGGTYFFIKQRETKRKLEKLNTSKNQLFEILAHDLKGPTASFTNLTQKLSYLIKKNEPERLLELGKYFELAGEQVNHVFSSLLDWAITQKDEFEHVPQELNIKGEIDKVINNMEYAFAAKDVEIDNRISVDKSLVFDKNALTIIVRNILHNAIKFSHKDSSIVIEYDEFGLKIKDSGIGMNSETKQSILKSKHISSRNGTNGERGNGIGLSTCMKLVEKNNARLKIESEEGVGTTFILKV